MNLIELKTSVKSTHPPQHPRRAALMACLEAAGFQTARHGAYSHEAEGEDTKALLRRMGFADTEFQIFVEYRRGWGFL